MSDSVVIEIDIWSDPVWPIDPALKKLNLPIQLDEQDVTTYRIEMKLVAVEVFAKINEDDGGKPGDVETLEWRSL